MASALPPVKVEVLYDGTKLKAGTEQSEASIEALADSVDAASDQMRASLASIDDGVTSTLGTGGTFSRSVDDVEVEGGRLKDVGAEVGAEFAANLQEGVASGDIKSTLLDTFSGLGAAAGATGQLGLAAGGVGVLLGATLIKGLTQAAEEKRAEFVAAVNEGFQQIEVKARTTFADIRKQFLEAFDFKSLLEELGEGDPNAALDKINQAAAYLKVPFGELVDVLRGEVNAENRDTLRLLQAHAAQINTELVPGLFTMTAEEEKQRDLSKELLEYAGVRRDKLADVVELSAAERDYKRETRDASVVLAEATERTAAALERAERASIRIGSNLGNAVRQADLINLALGGP